MKHALFREWGVGYLPISAMGWLASALALAFCVHIFLYIDARSHSAADTLYGIFPYVVPTLLAWYVLALRTSRERL